MADVIISGLIFTAIVGALVWVVIMALKGA